MFQYQSGTSSEVEKMESVRSHLHSMLQMTTHALPDKNRYDESTDDVSGLLANILGDPQPDNDSMFSAGSFQMGGPRNVSTLPSQYDSIVSFGSGILHSTANPQQHQVPGSSSSSSALFQENQMLKETLEKEKFRRKHLEKEIQQLQAKMLELQQQLAVAVSTDRKKDTMIEQLDKALAKVVDGWKKQDAEKVSVIEKLEAENKEFRAKQQKQEELLMHFEHEMSSVVEQLKQEQQRAMQAEQEKQQQEEHQSEERAHTLQLLELEKSRLLSMTEHRDDLEVKQDRMLQQISDLKTTLESERETWEEKEQEYLQKIDEITENHLKTVDQEKIQADKQAKLLDETQQVLMSTQTELQDTQIKCDTAVRDREGLRVEIGLLEARMESSKRKLEADLRKETEKQISEKLEEAHNRQAASEEEMRERHRKQLFELTQRQSWEMDEQLRQYQDDMRRKDDKIAQQALDFEEKLGDAKQELDNLKVYVKRLEGQRVDMTSKLQSMMQAHCNEALRLLQIGAYTSTNNAAISNLRESLQNTLQASSGLSLPGGSTAQSLPLDSQAAMSAADLLPSLADVYSTSSAIEKAGSTESRSFPGTVVSSHHGTEHDNISRQFIAAPNQGLPQPQIRNVPQPQEQYPQNQGQYPQPQGLTNLHQDFGPLRQSQQRPSAFAPPTNPQNGSISLGQPVVRHTGSYLHQPQSASENQGRLSPNMLSQNYNSSESQSRRSPNYLHSNFGSSQNGGRLSPHMGQHDQRSSEIVGGESLSSFNDSMAVTIRQGKVSPNTQNSQVPSSVYGQSDQRYVQQSEQRNVQPTSSEPSRAAFTHTTIRTQAPTTETGPHHQMMAENQGHQSQALPLRQPSFLETLAAAQDEEGHYHGNSTLNTDDNSRESDAGFTALLQDTTLESNADDWDGAEGRDSMVSHMTTTTGQHNLTQYSLASNGMNDTDYHKLMERVGEHQNRQTELQHYIKMLLGRSPREDDSEEEPVQDVQQSASFSPRRSQPDPIHFETGSNMNQTSQPPALPGSTAASQPMGVLSPAQVGDLARLLGHYRQLSTTAAGGQEAEHNPPVDELLNYLRELAPGENQPSQETPPTTPGRSADHSPRDPPTKETSKARRNLDVKFSAQDKNQNTKAVSTKASSPKPQRKVAQNNAHQGAAPTSKPNTTGAQAPAKKPDKKPMGKGKGPPAWK